MVKALTDERRGQIALLVLREKMKHERFQLSPDRVREIGNIAKNIGVPFGELKEFLREILQGLLDDCFDGDEKSGNQGGANKIGFQTPKAP